MKRLYSFFNYFSSSAPPVIITLPRSFVTALLASFFALAYLVTDYWNIPDAIPLKLIFLGGTILLAILWSGLAGNKARVEIKQSSWPYFLLLFAVIFILNFLPLTGDIPWRGDEDHHIRVTLHLYEEIFKIPWYDIVAILVTWGVILYLSWHKPKWAILVGTVSLALLIHFYPEHSIFGVLRYPYINYWTYFLAMFPGGLIFGPYHEVLYRIIPFLSVIALAWFWQRSLAPKQEPINLLWGLAIALIPSVYYYSSILYLEMPAIFLMTIVCLRSENLLTKSFPELKKDLGWYALILIGFIKETTLPFLLCFLLCRIVVTVWQRIKGNKPILQTGEYKEEKARDSIGQTIKGELAVYFVTLLPIVYYLSFREKFANTRSYHMKFSHLLNFEVYKVLAQSFLEQFGIFVFLFIAGGVLLIIKKKYPSFFFYVVLILGYSVFYMLDQKIYIGYSRFNLFLLPPLLASAGFLIKEVHERKKLVSYLLVVVILVSSIQRDGTKVPYWGNYLFDTSEHYYPVEEAVTWLKENEQHDSVLCTGMYYEYTFFFYARKVNWVPSKSDIFLSDIENQDDALNLENALIEAERQDYNNVLFFVLGEDIPPMPEDSVYHEEQVFQNMAHQIVIYSRDEQP